MTALNQTVGRLVAERPDRARVFEEFDIDYCCGGRRSLGEACARRGVDPGVVLRRLAAVDAGRPGEETNWEAAPVADLCDHIVATHHEFLRRELPRVGRLLAKVAGVHGERHPEMVGVLAVYEPFARDLAEHMAKEERVLFPLVKRLATGEVTPSRTLLGPVRVMEAEHDQAGEALAELRRLTEGFRPPADACNTYRAALAGLHDLEQDLHRHVHLENNVLFPQVEELIPAVGRVAGGVA
jgi:regulator of cell morphogenesis and NO signaling